MPARLSVAYADPPYVGLARRYPEKREVDHQELIGRLAADFPDGWALSCKANSARELWPLCPPDTRLGVWVKTYAPAVMNVRPAYCWEGVLFRGGRYTRNNIERDWVMCPPTMNQIVLGTKPELFCFWIFRILGLQAGDTVADLYPGSGAVGKAWAKFESQVDFTLAGAL